MYPKVPFYRSLNFWILSFVIVISLFYTCFSEIFPIDWFMTSQRYKNNPQFIYRKSFFTLFIQDKSLSYMDGEKYFKEPELLLQNIDYIFKDRQNKTKIALVDLEGKQCLVKKYDISNPISWFKNVPFRASKGFRSWYYAHELEKIGVKTAKPLFFIEKKWGPFWGSSYLVTEYIDGSKGSDYFGEHSPFKGRWNQALGQIDQLLSNLNNHLIIHGHLSLNNLIFYENEPYLIDLEHIHAYHFDHPFYRRRYQSQHLNSLRRRLKEINPSIEQSFNRTFALQSQ